MLFFAYYNKFIHETINFTIENQRKKGECCMYG